MKNWFRSRKYKSGTGWCFWRWTDVDSEYILRLHLLKTPWFALCLHWINKPDPEPYLHDHPVSFLSVIVRGGYSEARQKRGQYQPSNLVHRWFNFIRAGTDDKHNITHVKPNTLTFCIMGPKVREWGFHKHVASRGTDLICNEWIHWKYYYACKRNGVQL